jgi:hypothetical protein
MADNTQKTIVTGVSVLLLTAGLFFVSRAILSKLKARKQDESAGTLGNEQGSGTNQLTPQEEQEAKNYNPKADVDYIYSKISGWNYFVYPKEVNGRIMSLTDAKLKKMAQAYKIKNGGVSLYVALDDEWGSDYEPSMNRLALLNLK